MTGDGAIAGFTSLTFNYPAQAAESLKTNLLAQNPTKSLSPFYSPRHRLALDRTR